jgi:hypothetical protein
MLIEINSIHQVWFQFHPQSLVPLPVFGWIPGIWPLEFHPRPGFGWNSIHWVWFHYMSLVRFLEFGPWNSIPRVWSGLHPPILLGIPSTMPSTEFAWNSIH